jgi:hypothetical protein
VVLVRGAVETAGVGALIATREAVGVALPVGHPLAAQSSVAPADLNGEPLVTFARSADPSEFDRVYGALAAAGLTDLRVVHESHEAAVDASLRLVERGVGLSLKLASEVNSFGSAAVTWRALDGVAVDVVVSAAWRHDRVTPALRWFIRLLESDDGTPPPLAPEHSPDWQHR